MKLRRRIEILTPEQALDAIEVVMKRMVADPCMAEELRGTRQRPLAIEVTREGNQVETVYEFEIIPEPGSCPPVGARMPHQEHLLIPA